MTAGELVVQIVICGGSAATGVTVAAWRLSRELERLRKRIIELEKR